MKFVVRSVFLCGCAPLALLAAPAAAQENGVAEREARQADIIVTARRVEERLQDVPISISVFNQEQLAQRNISAGTDLALYTPSLSVTNQFGPDRASYAIRGFVQEANTAPSVGVFFADVVTPRGPQGLVQIGGGAGPGRFFDLQNVQVLKGPQGTLFGRNTTGGSVLLVPNKPTAQIEGYVEASIGNYDMRRLQAVVNLPLSDSFRLRAGFDRQKRDGTLRNVSGIGPERFSDIDYWAARITIDADLTPDLSNTLIANMIDSDTNGSLQKLIACAPTVGFGFLGCGQLQRAGDADDEYYDVRQLSPDAQSHSLEWQLVNTTVWQASDLLTVKNIASYGQQRLDYLNPLYATEFKSPAVPAFGLPGFDVPFLNLTPLPGYHAADQETFTEELQLQGNAVDNRLNWQAGFYFEKSQSISPGGQIAQVLISCNGVANAQCTDILGTLFNTPVGSLQKTLTRVEYRSIGVYGQASYAITDQLTATAGLRYTWDKSFVDQINTVTNYAFATPLPFTCIQQQADANCATQFRQKSQRPTWLLDLEYKPSNDILIFAKYARGYRTGGISASLPKEIAASSPEKVDDFELGVKANFSGALRGYFNATGFYNNFANQQLALSLVDNPAVPGVAPVATGVINVGKSRIYGAEVEAGIVPIDGLDLSVSYGHLNTRIREIVLPNLGSASPFIFNSAIVPGDELLQSPRHKVTATIRYTLPLEDTMGMITLGATFSHASSSRTNYIDRQALAPGFGAVLGTDLSPITSDLGIVPAYELLNLNLDWARVGGLPIDVSLFATNVTNERFITFTTGLLPTIGSETASLNEPRMYGMRIRYSF